MAQQPFLERYPQTNADICATYEWLTEALDQPRLDLSRPRTPGLTETDYDSSLVELYLHSHYYEELVRRKIISNGVAR
jgi:hypothetical protein